MRRENADMNERYADTFRVLMIDQHFPNAPYITFERFDAAEQVRRCKDALVDSLHVTTKCHWGYSYYNTQVGTKHPALGDRDQVGELVREIRKADMEAIAYYCILFDNLAARTHDDWRFITKDGKPTTWNQLSGDDLPHSWDMPCFMTGYGRYCLKQIGEFCSLYDFDGLFLDIFGLGTDYTTSICFCPDCVARYEGLGLNPYTSDPIEKFAIIRERLRCWAEFLSEVKTAIGAARPGMSISLNGGPFVESWQVLKQLSWPYNEGGSHAYNSVALRGSGLGSPQCGIPAGNDAYDSWPTSLVKIMTSTVLAHGGRTFFYFTQGRRGDGSFEESKYDFVRETNEETAAKQGYIKNAVPLTAAAVYHSEASWIEAGVRDKCGLNDRPKDSYTCIAGKMIDIFRGISVPCELLPSWRLASEELGRYKFIVLPELRCISDAEVAAFTQFVNAGGTLLVTGDTGLCDENNRPREDFAFVDLLGVDYCGVCTDYEGQAIGGYMRFEPHPFFARLRKTDYYMPGSFIKVEAREAEVLARIAEPVGIESYDSYIGWDSLPPGDKAEWPCLTVTHRGRGKAIYCAAPLGHYASTGVRWPIQLIRGIAEGLDVNAGIRFDGPEDAAEATFFRKDGKLIVHVLNQSVRNNDGAVVPIGDCSITASAFTPKSAKIVYPYEKTLVVENGKVNLPPVDIHLIVEMEI